MKRITAFLVALLFAAAQVSAGPFAGSGGTGTVTGTVGIANGGTGATTAAGARTNLGVAPYVGSVTYATLIANNPCNSTWNGYKAFVTDWGAYGTEVRCNSAISRWVPVGGRVMLRHLASAVSGIGSTATVVIQSPAMPAGTIQAGDSLVLDILGVTKTGTTDTLNPTAYLGTAGTTSDTSLGTFNTLLTAAQQAGDGLFVFKVAGNTSIQRVGTTVQGGLYSVAGAGGAPAAVTVTDLSANAEFISFAIASSGATNTVAIQDAVIWQIAP
jgi:hypothetical protein